MFGTDDALRIVRRYSSPVSNSVLSLPSMFDLFRYKFFVNSTCDEEGQLLATVLFTTACLLAILVLES